MFIYHSRALFLLIMNLANLEDLKAKIDRVPKDAGSEEIPELYHCGSGIQKESINWELQYGKRTRRYNMANKECSSSGLILKCTTTVKCKARVKLKVNDPKLIISDYAMEIALKIGDILSPPDPSKAYSKYHKYFSKFEFPTDK